MSSSAGDLKRRVDQAAGKKEEGNVAFREGDFRKASFFYKQVGILVGEFVSKGVGGVAPSSSSGDNAGLIAMLGRRSTISLSADDQVTVDTIFATTQSNLAGAHLKLQRYSEAKDCATSSVQMFSKYHQEKDGVLAPSHQRALFRLAQANAHLGNWEDAREHLSRLPPSDPAVVELLATLDALEVGNIQRERRLYAKMFS